MQSQSLSIEIYLRFEELIMKRCGMNLNSRRRETVENSVMSAAEHNGCKTFSEFYNLLRQVDTDSEPWDDLISKLVVGETHFFRHGAQFDALSEHIIPDLVSRHRKNRRLRIWSAACATGEEPYSIAILMRRLLPDIDHWNVHILATDIDKQALRMAIEGRYPEWSFRGTDPGIRDGCFSMQGDRFEIRPEFKRMVTYAYLNLAEDVYPALANNTNALDLVLCRNVAIYQTKAARRKITERFYRCLTPEGWLMIGPSETLQDLNNEFERRTVSGAIVYRKLPARVPARSTEKPLFRTGVIPPAALALNADAESGDLKLVPTGEKTSVRPVKPCEPYEEGMSLLIYGRYEEAKNCFRACIELQPGFALAFYQLARVHANMGRFEEACSLCRQAIELDPLMIEAHYVLALIHQEEGCLEQAVAELKKVLYLDPGFVLAHVSLVNIYMLLERQELANRHRTQAVRLASKKPAGEILPGSDDLTAGRLLNMVSSIM